MDALSQAVPYRLPHDTRDAVFALARILDIPRPIVDRALRRDDVNDAYLLGTMAGVILYRHLPGFEKAQVMARCQALLRDKLWIGNQLLTRVLDVWGVTPDWGVWSMSNEELWQASKTDARFKFWLDQIEKLGPTGGGVISSIFGAGNRQPYAVPAAVIGLIISGTAKVLNFETDYTDKKYGRELSRRQSLRTSKYYR